MYLLLVVFVVIVIISLLFGSFGLIVSACSAIGVFAVYDYIVISKREGNWWPL